MLLQPDESVLVGTWIVVRGAVDGDETCKRIEQLVHGYLKRIASADDGWSTVFLDESDGRYWELTYRHGEWHGGGPPTLICVSADHVHAKYEV